MYATAFFKIKENIKNKFRINNNNISICESNLLILDDMPNLNVECSICKETIASDGNTVHNFSIQIKKFGKIKMKVYNGYKTKRFL